MSYQNIVEIDGSFGAGGGAILRSACALSAVTKKPCRVFNIRKARPKPGLATQHLLAIKALAQLCQGRLEGDKIGSEEIKFYPGEIRARNLHLRIETAASLTLLLQSLLPIFLFTTSPMNIHFHGGGTDVPFSPTLDYFRYVFLKILQKMAAKVEVDIIKRGYYPAGGAEVAVKTYPVKLKRLNLIKRGPLKKIVVISGASEFLKQKKVAERQIAGIKEVLGKLKLPLEQKIEYYQTQSPGSQINIIGEFENTVIGADNLGKLGKSAEEVGREAAESFLREGKSNACLDKHSADQILPFMVLAQGKSSITVSEITEHCKTNIWVIEKFLDGKFEINNNLISWSFLK